MIDLLKTFIIVYQTKSFTLSAKILFISQPTVSIQIKKLEDVLEQKLFTRFKREVIIPTPEADLLYEHAQKIVTEWDNTKSLIQHNKRNQMIKIASSNTTSQIIIPYLINSLKNELPDDPLTIKVMNSEEIFAQVAEGIVDIGFIEKPMSDNNIAQSAIMDDELVLAGNLRSNLFFIREDGSGVRYYTEQYFARNPKKRTLVKISNNNVIMTLINKELGKSIVSKQLLPPKIPYRSLGDDFKRTFYLIYAKNNQLINSKIFNKILNIIHNLKE